MVRKSKVEMQKDALKDVKEYFKMAKENPVKGDFYVRKLRRIAMKVNLRLPKSLKRKFCKHCYSYYYKDNYRVRTRNKMVVYYCYKCKRYSRYKII